MEQDEYDDIFLYLKETKYVGGKNTDKRILRGKTKNFVLGSHDNLYYIKDSRKKQVFCQMDKLKIRSRVFWKELDLDEHEEECVIPSIWINRQARNVNGEGDELWESDLEDLALDTVLPFQTISFIMASFKVNLSVLKKHNTAINMAKDTSLGLPTFSKKDYTDLVMIGNGSYGKVFQGPKDGKSFVIKELCVGEVTDSEIKLFRKEAKLLKSYH
ncbi:unnamed protein product [Mytilus edulis]|uniref:Protein kinase domain-containing protein n=1 Tax=Mytilus edulis TaxID=6550 RepID=A0A8S3QHK4_MYTED|nr:unnamed protein product [Mytilus edulis]